MCRLVTARDNNAGMRTLYALAASASAAGSDCSRVSQLHRTLVWGDTTTGPNGKQGLARSLRVRLIASYSYLVNPDLDDDDGGVEVERSRVALGERSAGGGVGRKQRNGVDGIGDLSAVIHSIPKVQTATNYNTPGLTGEEGRWVEIYGRTRTKGNSGDKHVMHSFIEMLDARMSWFLPESARNWSCSFDR
jgi:hypothetical protein